MLTRMAPRLVFAGAALLVGVGAAVGLATTDNPLLGAAAGGGLGTAAALALISIGLRAPSAGTPAGARLAAGISAWMALYVLLVVLISWVFDIGAWPFWARIAASLSPAVSIGGAIHVLLRYLAKEPDEFQRMLMTRAVLLAMGIAFFIVTAWGFLEIYVDAPHFPASLVMAAFWGAFGFTNGWVRWRYR